ncbi:MAG: hypothetical protein ACOYNN_15030 [Terrimicrobiaceae bacterium]|jgi:DNA-directed RNA polymerase sigma subunit (sigma70/sigma32)
MNLRQGEGKVPVFTGGIKPFKLVPFPTREEFNDLYKNISQNSKDKYWSILQARAGGSMLADAGKPFGVTKERVRQIEAKFLRLMREK